LDKVTLKHSFLRAGIKKVLIANKTANDKLKCNPKRAKTAWATQEIQPS
jgi:hypothetical protein